MKPSDQNVLNRVGKRLAGPLSRVVANSATKGVSRLAEAYLSILLGKGAGTGWALDAEIAAAKAVIAAEEPVIFDVGANSGEWASLMHEVFPKSRIFMFEPQPDCQKSIAERGIPNSCLIPHAVSSSRYTTQLFTPGNNAGIASLHERKDSFFAGTNFRTIDVETVVLDEVIEERAVRRIDFMKMDIEGHELAALQGAQKSLADGLVKALSFEFGSANINSRTYFRDFWEFLRPLGYRISRILPSGRLMPIHSYYEDCEYFRGVSNYIAVREA